MMEHDDKAWLQRILFLSFIFIATVAIVSFEMGMCVGRSQAEVVQIVTEVVTEPETTTIVEETTEVVTETVTEQTPKAEVATTEVAKATLSDIELLALITMAEAEGTSDLTKRLVIDTILNRVDSPNFPNTIYGVIYQPNQFTPMWNGRINRCEVREDYCQLVREELENRTNSDVLYFRTDHYFNWGTPLVQSDNVYFSM